MPSFACRRLAELCRVFVMGQNDEEEVLLRGCAFVQQVGRFAACSKGRQVRVLLLCFDQAWNSDRYCQMLVGLLQPPAQDLQCRQSKSAKLTRKHQKALSPKPESIPASCERVSRKLKPCCRWVASSKTPTSQPTQRPRQPKSFPPAMPWTSWDSQGAGRWEASPRQSP